MNHVPDEPTNMPPGQGDDPIDRLARDARVERFPRARADRDGEPDADMLRENVVRWVQFNKIGNAELARMIGVSPGTVSEVLRGKYAGNAADILRKAEAAIGEWYNHWSGPARPQFVMTRVARELFAIVKTTSKHRGIGVVTGPSGCGKTIALAAIRRLDFPSAVAVEVNPGCAK